MKMALLVLILPGLLTSAAQGNRSFYFLMGNELELVSRHVPAFSFPNLNNKVEHKVCLLLGSDEQPLLFLAKISTPVCADGECKLAHINVYWDLQGNYSGYEASNELPLTKHEHDPFLEEDYQKLHELLMNSNSILGRRSITELVDSKPANELRLPSGVDGVSSATKKEIKSVVIQGALYTSYTIWRLVHGEVVDKIKSYYQTHYASSLIENFLYAPYEAYQFAALRAMDSSHIMEHNNRIIALFKESKPLFRTYLFKKLPDNFLNNKEVTKEVYKSFSAIDINSKTLLIQYLNFANPAAVQILSSQIGQMSRNQLRSYLKFLSGDKTVVSKMTKDNLGRVADSEEYNHSYLVREFLALDDR